MPRKFTPRPFAIRWRPGPARVLLAGAVIGLSAVVATISLALQAPWAGVQFSAAPRDRALTVSRVFQGPAAGKLNEGDVVVALIDASGQRRAVDAVTLVGNPYLLPTWARFDERLEIADGIYRALRTGPVDFEFQDGRRATVHAAPSTPPMAFPAEFWLALGAALLSYVICLSVWAYRPRDGAARALALCGAAVLVTFCIVALASHGPWVLPAALSRTMYHLNVVSLSFAAFAFLAVLWYYPSALRPLPFISIACAGASLGSMPDLLRWVSHPGHATVPALVAYAVLTVPVGVAQWRRNRDQPLERAALKWLYLVLLSTAGFVAMSYSVPIALGTAPLVPNVLNLFAAAALFGGIALGVVRYRLFNLDRWWFEAGLWALGGFLVIALDALLVWLTASRGIALATSLALAGWLWFPLRQALWQRFSPAAQQLSEHLPRLVETLFSARNDGQMQQRWQELLVEIYSPLHVAVLPDDPGQPAIRQDGLVLHVPGLAGQSIELTLSHKGQRLFGTEDRLLAGRLLELARQALRARQALERHDETERIRHREKELLVQDLHDGLGGTVTNIALLADMGGRAFDTDAARRTLGAIAELAREGAADIRSFMTAVDEADDADWEDVVADLRQCARGLLEPHAIERTFEVSVSSEAAAPEALLRINLLRAFKEMLNNVIKHSGAGQVSVAFGVQPGGVRLVVEDDGKGFAPGTPDVAGGNASRGLRHLRQRAAAMGGSLELESAPGRGTRLTLSVALPARSPKSGMEPRGSVTLR